MSTVDDKVSHHAAGRGCALTTTAQFGGGYRGVPSVSHGLPDITMTGRPGAPSLESDFTGANDCGPDSIEPWPFRHAAPPESGSLQDPFRGLRRGLNSPERRRLIRKKRRNDLGVQQLRLKDWSYSQASAIKIEVVAQMYAHSQRPSTSCPRQHRHPHVFLCF
jgi:hypothetical protein